jgi:thyroxine 5-deiodinase
MDNKCSLAYGAFPERYYIIHNGKIVLLNGLGPEFYDPSKVKLWVESYMKSIILYSPKSPHPLPHPPTGKEIPAL